MFIRRKLQLDISEGILELSYSLAHRLYFVMKLLGVRKDESRGDGLDLLVGMKTRYTGCLCHR